MGAFTVAVEGATLSGETSGSGTPLVFLHGMAGERHDWDRLLAAFPPAFPPGPPPSLAILRYDLRGFGRSAAEEGAPFSHADDLLALLDARGIERPTIVGLSMGGGVALNFALNHPERIDRLVLLSPAMVGWEWSPEWKALWRGVADAARAGNLALARDLWWRHPMFDLVRKTEAGRELHRAIAAYHGRQWVRDDQRRELPDVDRLHTLAAPTLLLTGEKDVADIRLIAEVIAAAAPDVSRIDLPGAGHMLHLERPREVAQAIAAFVS